jgi:hypothetical protein
VSLTAEEREWACEGWRLGLEMAEQRQHEAHAARMVEWLARRAGLERFSTWEGHDAIWATSLHEAGHALAFIVSRTPFYCIELDVGGGGRLTALAPRVDAIGPACPETQQLIQHAAGAAAQDVVIGAVGAVGAAEDLTVAFTLARTMAHHTDREHGEGLVRAAVVVAREIIVRERASVVALAEALRARGRLLYADCFAIMRRCGLDAAEPTFSARRAELDPWVRQAVLADCAAAVAPPPSFFTQRLDAERKEAAELRARIEREVDAQMAAEGDHEHEGS